MTVHRARRGLDLHIAGEPAQRIDGARPPAQVALLGADYPGLRPVLEVQPGDQVRRGQPLFHERTAPAVRFTSPAAGRVSAVHRGERRALVAVVVDVAEDALRERCSFTSFTGRDPAALEGGQVRALLLESGLWTALRTRPFGRVPVPDAAPQAVFVTAIDTRPHAPGVEGVVASREEDFAAGLHAVGKLTDGATYLCVAAGTALRPPPGCEAIRVEFAGPHPSGNVGWHIHRLHPVSLDRRVWHLNYQDVLAIGRLFLSGELDMRRVIALGGPGVAHPRLLATTLGASIDALVAGELQPGEQRVISGSVLDGRRVTGPEDAFLGRYHLQVSVLPEGRHRELFGWIAPAGEKFSVTRAVLSAYRGARRLPLTTTTNGSPRAMVPIGSYERVMPFDLLPTFLLRALITRDDVRAAELGALELDEEDVALCTCVCPGKYEYGPLLRDALTRIEKEA